MFCLLDGVPVRKEKCVGGGDGDGYSTVRVALQRVTMSGIVRAVLLLYYESNVAMMLRRKRKSVKR